MRARPRYTSHGWLGVVVLAGLLVGCSKSPTAPGLIAPSKVDADSDGIIDSADICPSVSAPDTTNGCPNEDVLVSVNYHRRPPITYPEYSNRPVVICLYDFTYETLGSWLFNLPEGLLEWPNDEWEWPNGVRFALGTKYYINVYDGVKWRPGVIDSQYVNQDIYVNNTLVTTLVTLTGPFGGKHGNFAAITIIDREGHFK